MKKVLAKSNMGFRIIKSLSYRFHFTSLVELTILTLTFMNSTMDL